MNYRKMRTRKKQGCQAAARVHVGMVSPFCGGNDWKCGGAGCTHERVRVRVLVKGVEAASLQTVVNGAARVGDELLPLNPSDGSRYHLLKL